VQSSRLGQVDFPVGQPTLYDHLPDQKTHLPIKSKKAKQKQAFTCPVQAKFESYSSEGQAQIQIFFKPCIEVND